MSLISIGNAIRKYCVASWKKLRSAVKSIIGGSRASSPLLDFSAVLREEFDAIFQASDDSRDLHAIRQKMVAKDSAALCLSGGGIRSAAFSLGVLTGLAKHQFLPKFHYLSTVSGGGYTGSLISAWTYRAGQGINEVQASLSGKKTAVDAVAGLRKYTRYLSPHKGVISADSWALIAIYLRNLLLNWLILIPLLALLIAVPLLMPSIMDWMRTLFVTDDTWTRRISNYTFATGFFMTILAVFELRRCTILSGRFGDKGAVENSYSNTIILTTLCSGILFFTASWFWQWRLSDHSWGEIFGRYMDLIRVPSPLQLAACYSLLSAILALWFIAKILFNMRLLRRGDIRYLGRNLFGLFFAFCVTGFLAGSLMYGWSLIYSGPEADQNNYYRFFITTGPPALLAIFIFTEIIFQGLASRLIDDYDREWWSRSCACMLRIVLLWLVLVGIALWGYVVINLVREKFTDFWQTTIPALITFGGVIARLFFTRSSKNQKAVSNHQTTSDKYIELGFNVAGLIVILLLMCILSWAIESSLVYLGSINYWKLAVPPQPLFLNYNVVDALTLIAALTVIGTIFAVAVNINHFSLHSMYRTRLIRAFLGVSREKHPRPATARGFEAMQFRKRHANPFTDFDWNDDPYMWWLSPLRHAHTASQSTGATDDKAPLHVVNCALNLVGDRRLGVQDRKATSFTISPLHAGTEEKYRRSQDYCGEVGGITLGAAMAMSGAAVSPNAGRYSSPIMTFLLTLFNARLGWWLGNPENDQTMRKTGPRIALEPMIRELFGLTNKWGRWIYLSDGGHFDNLGLYEMVRRGCRYIVVIDASADLGRNFDDLGYAIERIRIDLGISVNRTREWRIGHPNQGSKGRYCALFNIGYHQAFGAAKDGELLYIKPSYYPHENNMLPIDVMGYAGRAAEFPHESTLNQFFSETQFESYRALGEAEIETIFAGFAGKPDVASLFNLAYIYI